MANFDKKIEQTLASLDGFEQVDMPSDFEQKIRSDPKDLKLRYSFAIQEFENSSYEKAIVILLDLIKIDRNWNDKAANQLLLKFFAFLGSDNELVIKNRKELSKILY